MRTIVPFGLQASVGCPAPGELLLALAAETHEVDGAAADRALDDIAAPLSIWRHARAEVQLQATADALCDHLAVDPDHPGGLALDTALALGVAHPLIWCVAGTEAARRAGIGLGVVAGDTGVFALGHPGLGGPLVVDPYEAVAVDPHTLTPGGLQWRCSHQLTHLLLGLLAGRAAAEGRHDDVRHAVELALGLPLSPARGAPW